MENALNMQVAAIREVRSLSGRTRSKSKRPADEQQLYEKDGVILSKMKTSAGSIIKSHAVKLAKRLSYAAMNNQQRNAVCCGLNSIIDLSNNSREPDSQCRQFNEIAWQELKNRAYISRKMLQPPVSVINDLKVIEEAAGNNVKHAYVLSLEMLKVNAFSEDEPYYEIYAHILRLMTRENSILRMDPRKCTEEDFLGQVWTPMFASVFDDELFRMKWGDSVAKTSTAAKRSLLGDKGKTRTIGDRIDMRLVTTIDTDEYDILNGEFASDATPKSKFFSDHGKVLRESKLIIDRIAGSQFISRNEVSRIVAPSFQATGIDGEMMVLRLVAPGLYAAQYMGSLPVPNQATNLHWLRTKCVPRLMYMKKQAVKNAKLLTKMINKENRMKRRKSTAMLRSPSYDSDDEMFEPWTRGSWFPPSRPVERIVVPKDIL